MSHPKIILPFALPPKEHARDLVRLLSAGRAQGGLARLLSRPASTARQSFDDFARSLPHETALAEQHAGVLQLAAASKLVLDAGYWFMLTPVHLHIATNHLVLTDYRQLQLDDGDARRLFEVAQQRCAEAGLQLLYGNASQWLLRADHWSDLVTSTPDAACGHNIDIWSPQGAQALAWRKLQNEIQMEWFIHPVQNQREQSQLKSVNGLWLWSGCRVDGSSAVQTPAQRFDTAAAWLAAPDRPTTVVLDQLTGLALAGDWANWAKTLQQLDLDWLTPLCQALQAGQINELVLVLSNSNTLLTSHITRSSLRRFWRKIHLNALL